MQWREELKWWWKHHHHLLTLSPVNSQVGWVLMAELLLQRQHRFSKVWCFSEWLCEVGSVKEWSFWWWFVRWMVERNYGCWVNCKILAWKWRAKVWEIEIKMWLSWFICSASGKSYSSAKLDESVEGNSKVLKVSTLLLMCCIESLDVRPKAQQTNPKWWKIGLQRVFLASTFKIKLNLDWIGEWIWKPCPDQQLSLYSLAQWQLHSKMWYVIGRILLKCLCLHFLKGKVGKVPLDFRNIIQSFDQLLLVEYGL